MRTFQKRTRWRTPSRQRRSFAGRERCRLYLTARFLFYFADDECQIREGGEVEAEERRSTGIVVGRGGVSFERNWRGLTGWLRWDLEVEAEMITMWRRRRRCGGHRFRG